MEEYSKMLHIVGIVGVPSSYGGFETLVDQLIESEDLVAKGIVIYCEAEVVKKTGPLYKGAALCPLNWKANGWQSIIYDSFGMILGSIRGTDVLVLGASATLVLPILRLLFPRVRFYVNMAGLEWKRSKWGPAAKLVIKVNEWAAAKFSHKLIADNEGLVEYVKSEYGIDAVYIPYGGDQYLYQEANPTVFEEWDLPSSTYDYALARAQSDNNLELILDAYVRSGDALVCISNWESNAYGRELKERYACHSNVHLVGPIYDVARVKAIQARARLYVHGHSAGGTNPALVEAMWAGLPTLAFDVSFNRHTTENNALYFSDTECLIQMLSAYDEEWARTSGSALLEIAKRKFMWSAVRTSYLNLLRRET
jgi:glycosyltransferase involved in cell wall biosynthesis